MCLNHPENIQTPQSVEKLSFVKLVSGVKMIGDRCTMRHMVKSSTSEATHISLPVLAPPLLWSQAGVVKFLEPQSMSL